MEYKLKKAKAIFPYFLSNMENRWKKVHVIDVHRWKIFPTGCRPSIEKLDTLMLSF